MQQEGMVLGIIIPQVLGKNLEDLFTISVALKELEAIM